MQKNLIGKTSEETFNYISEISNNINFENKNKSKATIIKKIKNFDLNEILKKNIFILSYSTNFFLGIFLFYFLYFFSPNKIFPLNYILSTSSCLLLTQIFSANARNIILAENSVFLATRSSILRIILSSGIILMNFIISKSLIGINDNSLIFFSSLLVCSCWIREINVAKAEIINNLKSETINLILFSLFFIFFFFNYLISPSKFDFYLFICLYSIITLKDVYEYLIEKFSINKINLFYSFKNLNFNLLEFSFLSGFFLTFANFIIRVMVDNSFTSDYAADFIIMFSVATLPATLIASVFGQSFLKKEKSYPPYVKILFNIYLFLFLTSLVLILLQIQSFVNVDINILFVISLSGVLYYVSQTFRQISIIKNHTRNLLFKRYIFF